MGTVTGPLCVHGAQELRNNGTGSLSCDSIPLLAFIFSTSFNQYLVGVLLNAVFIFPCTSTHEEYNAGNDSGVRCGGQKVDS